MNQILHGEQVQKATMGETCSTHGIADKCIQTFSWKPERERKGRGRGDSYKCKVGFVELQYRGADKSLARPTSRCILFDGENISFDASLYIYINSTNIPPIMIINRIYEHQNLL